MGGGKETPRQKMIGLMYLVLMALLAINVSKEVINAFVTLNNKMERQNQSTERNNIGIRSGLNASIMQAASEANMDATDIEGIIKEAKDKGIEKVAKLGFLLEQYDKTHAMSIRKVNVVMDMADELLKAGDASQGWVEEGERGYKYIVELNDHEKPYGKKDDYDTPTRMFVDEGRGEDLLKTMYEFRDSLVLVVAMGGTEKDSSKLFGFELPEVKKANNEDTTYLQTVIDAFPEYQGKSSEGEKLYNNRKDAILGLYQSLTFPEEVDNHGEQVPWVQGAFDHSPMVAAAALFTSLKGQMLQAENIVLGFLEGQNDVPPFVFDTIEPKSFASTSYVNSGDSLTLEVMIAAYDSKKLPKIRYWVDDTLESPDKKIESDISKIALGKEIGGSVGEHIVTGQITVEENGQTKWIDFTPFRYKVGAPTSAIGNAEMNVMYRGYANKIVASGSGYSDVNATCSGCSSWAKQGDVYVAKVGGGSRATVTVTGKDDKGKSVTIGTQDFNILPMPKPTVYILGASGDKIARNQAAVGQLFAKLEGSPLQMACTVTGGVVRVGKNGVFKDYPFSGAAMPPSAAGLIRQLPSGAVISIKPKINQGGIPVQGNTIAYTVL